MMQKLFDHMEQTHGLILTESELQDIVSAVGMDVRQLLSRMVEERDKAVAAVKSLKGELNDLCETFPKIRGHVLDILQHFPT